MKMHLLMAAAAVATMTALPVGAQSYTTGSGIFTNLGDDGRNSGYDQVALTSNSGNVMGSGIYNFNNVTFTTGANRNNAATVDGLLGGLTGTFNGKSFTYGVDYTLNIGDIDTITLGGNTFSFGGANFLINPITLTTGGTASGLLTANVTTGAGAVPEPATWTMMLLGFGMIGVGLRYRRKSTKVSFA